MRNRLRGTSAFRPEPEIRTEKPPGEPDGGKSLGRGKLTKEEQSGNKSFPADRICATVNDPLKISIAMANEEGMDDVSALIRRENRAPSPIRQ